MYSQLAALVMPSRGASLQPLFLDLRPAFSSPSYDDNYMDQALVSAVVGWPIRNGQHHEKDTLDSRYRLLMSECASFLYGTSHVLEQTGWHSVANRIWGACQSNHLSLPVATAHFLASMATRGRCVAAQGRFAFLKAA